MSMIAAENLFVEKQIMVKEVCGDIVNGETQTLVLHSLLMSHNRFLLSVLQFEFS